MTADQLCNDWGRARAALQGMFPKYNFATTAPATVELDFALDGLAASCDLTTQELTDHLGDLMLTVVPFTKVKKAA